MKGGKKLAKITATFLFFSFLGFGFGRRNIKMPESGKLIRKKTLTNPRVLPESGSQFSGWRLSLFLSFFPINPCSAGQFISPTFFLSAGSEMPGRTSEIISWGKKCFCNVEKELFWCVLR